MWKNLGHLLIGMTVSLLGLSACGPHKALEAALVEVAEFHQRLDQGDYASIYRDTDADFRTRSTEQAFAQKLDAVHTKLGAVRSTEQTLWHHSTLNSDTLLVLKYKTRFTKGEATETFTYRTTSARVSLMAYAVDSPLVESK